MCMHTSSNSSKLLPKFTLANIYAIYTYTTSIDVLPSKNQALFEYCTLVSNLNIVDTLISLAISVLI